MTPLNRLTHGLLTVNIIPSESINFTGTADTFKRKRDLCLKDVPDRPALPKSLFPKLFREQSGGAGDRNEDCWKLPYMILW